MIESNTKQLFLEIIKGTLSGERCNLLPISVQKLPRLLGLAQAHKLLPVIVDAVHDCDAVADWKDFEAYKLAARVQVVQQALQEQEFLAVYGRLKAVGICALVLKGCVCRSVWPNGDLRLSADEDLYVRPEDYEAVCAVLKECGMEWDGKESSHKTFETGWRKPGSTLYIEVHQKLFSPHFASVSYLQAYVDDAFDRAAEYAVVHGSVNVWSMSPQDHMLYLLLHAFTHFINSGFGIRQVCDIGLWAKDYSASIDWERLYQMLEDARLLFFAASVFMIAKNDLGIDLSLPECWRLLSVDQRPMLEDLLDSGAYGGSSMSRSHSGPFTREAVVASRERRHKQGLLRHAFPPKAELIWDYPELNTHPAQLPNVWVKRLIRYWKETRNTVSNSAKESIQIAKKRELLLKMYKII